MSDLLSGFARAAAGMRAAVLIREAGRIEDFKPAAGNCSDGQLRGKTDLFRRRIDAGGDLESALYEACAAAGEALKRTLTVEPSVSQFAGGIALYRGFAVHMRSEEDVVPAVVIAVYLSAIEGKGVHVVAPDDFFAERSAEHLGAVHSFLGLSVGTVLDGTDTAGRKAAYACDVTYVSRKELCLDYLRDNMAESRDSLVLRGLNCAVFEDATSVLIDGAHDPVVIRSGHMCDPRLYFQCDEFVKNVVLGGGEQDSGTADADIVIDRENGNWDISDSGVRKAQEVFGLDDYSCFSSFPVRRGIDNAVRANFLMVCGKDYVCDGSSILPAAPSAEDFPDGDCFPDGLRQALEVKEGVPVTAENAVCAVIAYQSFFNKYKRKCGAAKTAYKELFDVYDLKTVDFRLHGSDTRRKPSHPTSGTGDGLFPERLRLAEYDLVLDEHRDELYRLRMEVLCCENPAAFAKDMTAVVVSGLAEAGLSERISGRAGIDRINETFRDIFLCDGPVFTEGSREEYTNLATGGFCDVLDGKISAAADKKAAEEGIRSVLLSVIDEYWMQFLKNADLLVRDPALYARSTADPAVLYGAELRRLFNLAYWMIMVDGTANIFRLF